MFILVNNYKNIRKYICITIYISGPVMPSPLFPKPMNGAYYVLAECANQFESIKP